MTFTIFNKTGEVYDRQGDWDGNIGEEYEIEVKDAEVNKALAEIIFDTYFYKAIPYNEHSHDTTVKEIKKQIGKLLSDCDIEEMVRESFIDELNEWVQEEFGDD